MGRGGTGRSPRDYDLGAVWSWAFYDFANSPFTTLVVTFIYATYFSQVIVDDGVRGTALWSRGVTVSAIAVALLSPLLGAMADRGGYRKAFLLVSTGACVAGTTALYFVLPGEIGKALTIFVLANISFEMGNVFYNAFLPDIAPARLVGRVSGYGWALGYVGGLLALVLALVCLVQPETPWFGFSKAGGEHVRATNLLVAVWFAVFSLPIFLRVPEDRSAVTRSGSVLGAAYRQIVTTFREIRKHRQIVRLLLARILYNDGVLTVIAFAGIYASETLGFETADILLFGIGTNVAAGLGAFALGFLDDLLGGKRTVRITLVGLSVGALLAVVAPGPGVFWLAGIVFGIFLGPNQSASRSLMARFVPPDKENEFFGFFAFSGKATAFLGPLLLGILTEAFGSVRAGLAVVLVFFAAGYVVLETVDEAEGIRSSGRDLRSG